MLTERLTELWILSQISLLIRGPQVRLLPGALKNQYLSTLPKLGSPGLGKIGRLTLDGFSLDLTPECRLLSRPILSGATPLEVIKTAAPLPPEFSCECLSTDRLVARDVAVPSAPYALPNWC